MPVPAWRATRRNESLLRSLVTQLGWKEPSLLMLLQMCQKPNASIPGVDELERVLLACIELYDELFLLMDALDECPEDGEVRQRVLEGLERIARQAPNVRMFVTSREATEVRESMRILGAEPVSTAVGSMDADIQRYLSTQLSSDRKLSKLDTKTKGLVEDVISRKADGMFRWAYCQLQELKKLKSTKPKYVEQALSALPTTLDETYERMLAGIDEMYRDEALTLLRWLTYARSPPTLGELAEASIIDPSGEGFVDFGNRGGLEGTLEILGGLITCVKDDHDASSSESNIDLDSLSSISNYPEDDNNDDNDDDNDDDEGGGGRGGGGGAAAAAAAAAYCKSNLYDYDYDHILWSGQKIHESSRVRLAHFSVKEYLESRRITQSSTKAFSLNSNEGHRFIAQSCLTYIIQYSRSDKKSSSASDLRRFPLLQYAAQSWPYHSLIQPKENVDRELILLQSDEVKWDWLLIHCPDMEWKRSFVDSEDIGSGLYYACFIGLQRVVEMLLNQGADVNAQGGRYGNSLQAASNGGHEKVVEMLLEGGADVNARGGVCGNALQAASAKGHEKVVGTLLKRGADVNAQGGYFGSALCAASHWGYEKVVEMLLTKGADLDTHKGKALEAASGEGHRTIVEMLLERGADVNFQQGTCSNALQLASAKGYEKIVGLLLERGADVNARESVYGSALQAASFDGHEIVVEMLLEHGAEVNCIGGYHGNALNAALFYGHDGVVKTLLGRGANINAQGGRSGNALQAASYRGSEKVAEMLIERGADINAQGGRYGNALQAASARGNEKVVSMLLERGADINAQGGRYGNALQAASAQGYEKVVSMLLERGADVSAQGGRYGNALQAASEGGYEKVAEMLIAKSAHDTMQPMT